MAALRCSRCSAPATLEESEVTRSCACPADVGVVGDMRGTVRRVFSPAAQQTMRPRLVPKAPAPGQLTYRCTRCQAAAEVVGNEVCPGCSCGAAIVAEMSATATGVGGLSA